MKAILKAAATTLANAIVVAASGSASAMDTGLMITEAKIDASLSHLFISGQGFSKRDNIALGNYDVTSQCGLADTSGTLIFCSFVSSLAPGSYRILITEKNDRHEDQSNIGRFDFFDLTTPLAGPAGPKGPQGLQGSAGAQGPPGVQACKDPLAQQALPE